MIACIRHLFVLIQPDKVDIEIIHKKLLTVIGSLQRMIQNIAIANGTAIGSTLINLTAPNLPPGIQVTWYLALFVVAIIVIAGISINYLHPEKA